MHSFLSRISFAALTIVMLYACTPVTPDENFQSGTLNDINRLSVGTTLNISSESLHVRFDSVSEDSRCPENMVCIWSGNARVHCTIIKNQSSKQQIVLNTTTMPQNASYQGYTIRLAEVTPLPKAGERTPQSAYRAGITITK